MNAPNLWVEKYDSENLGIFNPIKLKIESDIINRPSLKNIEKLRRLGYLEVNAIKWEGLQKLSNMKNLKELKAAVINGTPLPLNFGQNIRILKLGFYQSVDVSFLKNANNIKEISLEVMGINLVLNIQDINVSSVEILRVSGRPYICKVGPPRNIMKQLKELDISMAEVDGNLDFSKTKINFVKISGVGSKLNEFTINSLYESSIQRLSVSDVSNFAIDYGVMYDYVSC